ncbi:aa3-type cytochrome c oxidase subunit IV [Novosphingobium sp. M1R2S20]|uniref:Aa3-type cytochrome c oxidase subunit IV n=1 Tax=Novosphingobium rhizovicinum TaxID=3228928 RepID=A0ABV3RG07_9SPHN
MASGKNMKAANDTYSGFLTLVKVGTISSIIAAVAVVMLIA